MNKYTVAILILAITVLGSPLFALAPASERALDAFRRYEPDFSNSLRRLEELDRRMDNLDIAADSPRGIDIKDEAEETLDRVQRRYDLMEDLFTNVSADYPADRAQLFEGFTRIDDLYRSVRDAYLQKFLYRGQKPADQPTESPAADDSSAGESKPAVSEPADAEPKTAAATTGEQEDKRVDISGVLKLDFRNRNEVYRTQTNAVPNVNTETALPNNLRQGRLALTFKFDEKRQLFAENRFLKRERNEPVHENYFTLSYMHKVDQDHVWTFKNSLQHAWYPENGVKDYRNNLAEVFYNERWTKRERLANIGYQTRVYPQYARSDFHQVKVSDQETWFKGFGTIFAELKGNWRSYRNVDDLDYDNFNLYTEYNRSYSGNKAELSLSNTYDRRSYDQEAVNLYRSSYYDNYFRANYELPIHDKLAYGFEGQYQKRNYGSDELRGYAEANLFTVAKFKIDKDTRAQADYRYIYNDENTRIRAHKNHKVHGMWQKSYNKDFKVRIDDTYHMRTTVIGESMDFRENFFNAKLSWHLKNKIDLTWNNEYLTRFYDESFYRDFRYFLSGLNFSYAKPGSYDWKVDQSWRKFSFRNGNNVLTGWESEAQPITQLQYNYIVSSDLKLRLRASWEKSYYRSFDSLSQELLWDFARPMTVTEFFGGLEYTF